MSILIVSGLPWTTEDLREAISQIRLEARGGTFPYHANRVLAICELAEQFLNWSPTPTFITEKSEKEGKQNG